MNDITTNIVRNRCRTLETLFCVVALVGLVGIFLVDPAIRQVGAGVSAALGVLGALNSRFVVKMLQRQRPADP